MAKENYAVEGMTCATCALTVEKVLGKLEGVDQASVNLASETVSLDYDQQVLSFADLEAAVEGAGYRLVRNLKTETFDIQGMTCATCALTVEKAVGKLAGVEEASVNLATEKLTVTYDGQNLSLSQIVEAVTKAGYQALPQAEATSAEPAPDRQEVQTKELWTRFVWSAVFTLPLLYLAMGPMLPWGGLPLPAFLNPAHQSVRYALTQLSLTLPVVYLGRSFYVRGFKNLLGRHPNMDSLIAIGTSAA